MATLNFQFFVNVTQDPTRKYISFADGYRPGAHMKLGYVGTVEADTIGIALDKLFERFNIDHPADYKLSSMSIGDVVIINDVAYACASVGWQYLGSFDPNAKNPAWTARI